MVGVAGDPACALRRNIGDFFGLGRIIGITGVDEPGIAAIAIKGKKNGQHQPECYTGVMRLFQGEGYRRCDPEKKSLLFVELADHLAQQFVFSRIENQAGAVDAAVDPKGREKYRRGPFL
jgi:hypothetical protein